MTTKSRKHKQYKPRAICAIGGLALVSVMHARTEDQQPLHADDLTDLNLAYRLSFDQMVRGASNEEAWTVVVCSLNVALILTERGFGKEYLPYINRALEGAYRARLRAEKHKVWRFDGDAINAIREALEVHDEQVKFATKDDMRQALEEVHRRIIDGNVYQKAA
jgi:hypothetical protein